MAGCVDIYALIDPRDGSIRYIGKARNSKARFASHLRDAHTLNRPVHKWIRGLFDLKLLPRLSLIERCDESAWEDRERFHIARARALGDLLNVANGGAQPHCLTSVRASNGKSNAKKIHSNPAKRRIWEIKLRIGQILRQGYISNETRAKMRLAAMKRPDLFGQWINTPNV